MANRKPDFGGWATWNDLVCTDGRVIKKDAFAVQDGTTVPLVWNHSHSGIENTLGHAMLENRPEGVYTYGYFNDTPNGNLAKQLVQHGDLTKLSICAGQLKQKGSDVLHGVIKEVSLVLAGANPGAFIDSVMAHGDGSLEEAIIYTDKDLDLDIEHEDSEPEIKHADEPEDKKESKESEKTIEEIFNSLTDKQKDAAYAIIGAALGEESDEDDEEEAEHADNSDSGESIKEIFETFTEDQKTVVYAMIGMALEHSDESEEDDEEEENDMKHNLFEGGEAQERNVLTHADQVDIINFAKQDGSFKRALGAFLDEHEELQHAATPISGFAQTGTPYNISTMFPEFKEARGGQPEIITEDLGWVDAVINGTHKIPFTRVRTSQIDIRKIDELRARGYKKGDKKKITGNYNLIRRTTEPQTVYVRSDLHRDDVLDITDFDYVQFQYKIDSQNLRTELANAIMFGDGRDEGSADKIFPDKIRPIFTDDDLYTLHVDLDVAKFRDSLQGTDTAKHFGDNFVTAEAMVETIQHAMKDFRGTGTPDMFITPDMLTTMLLSRDMNGRRMYSSLNELATALGVGKIHKVEQMADKTRKDEKTGKTKKPLAILVNMADYSLGANKGGDVTHFTDFDIDFNQYKSLLETRKSGALTRIYSALVIEEEATGSTSID